MADDSFIFLIFTGQEARHVCQGDDGEIECIAVPNKTSCFIGGITIQYTCHEFWLVCDDTNSNALDASKTDNDILGKFLMNF